jgi:hypothetical protein
LFTFTDRWKLERALIAAGDSQRVRWKIHAAPPSELPLAVACGYQERIVNIQRSTAALKG